jgi:hypothetical protein
MAESRTETPSLYRKEEVAAMGGPGRERGFDARMLRSPHSGRRAEAMARGREQDGLGKVVLAYIAAIIMSFGLMMSLQNGW